MGVSPMVKRAITRGKVGSIVSGNRAVEAEAVFDRMYFNQEQHERAIAKGYEEYEPKKKSWESAEGRFREVV